MPNSLPSDLERVYVKLLDVLATPTSQLCKKLVQEGRWDDLVSIKIDPLTYDDSESYFRDAAAVSFLRKCADIPTSFDREAVAFNGFVSAEQQCKRTNDRLAIHFLEGDLDRSDDLVSFPEGACARLIAEARKEMRKLLGRVPNDLRGKFGPGATYGDRGQLTTVPDKMSSRPTYTPSAVWWLFPWSSTLWAKACIEDGREVEGVRGNRFTTVPKDCTKDRGIAVEPSINVFYQLAIGKAIRSALKRNGNIDLTHGQDIHKRVACEASTHGCFATLDLSNASDTVSSNLVKLLLPTQWYDLLSSLRSPFTQINGLGTRDSGVNPWVRLEKFSSMGNGFTFELETAIFLAIILAVRNLRSIKEPLEALIEPGRDVFVYGDDIIIPTDYAPDVVSALNYCGFTLNATKSFVSGPFRESCGGDYFRGVDVRPFFLKEYPNGPEDWVKVANGIKRMVTSSGDYSQLHDSLLRPWFACLDNIPLAIRSLRGPEKLGDLVIHDDPERWQTRKRGSLNYIKVYRPAQMRVISWANWKPEVVLAAACYGTGDGRRGVTPRDAVSGYKIGWVPLVTASSKWEPPWYDDLDRG